MLFAALFQAFTIEKLKVLLKNRITMGKPAWSFRVVVDTWADMVAEIMTVYKEL